VRNGADDSLISPLFLRKQFMTGIEDFCHTNLFEAEAILADSYILARQACKSGFADAAGSIT